MFRMNFCVAAALALGACAPITPPAYLTAPADAGVRVRDPAYAPVTAGVKDYRVVEPRDWRELNREVTPQDGEGHGDHGMGSTSGARRAR